MTEKLILPPDYLENLDAPLIFLAGPIQGSYRWQDHAIQIIKEKAPSIYIASPRRNVEIKYQKGDFTKEMYNEQVDWETHHLRKAGENGTILFWLASELEHNCERAYAQTSRFELGEWKVRHERDGINLVVGIEDGFTNARYIKRRFSQDCPNVLICSTLEQTCYEAINKLK